MKIKQIIKEAMEKNPVGLKEALQEELRKRVAIVLEAKMKEEDFEVRQVMNENLGEAVDKMDDGYYVTDHMGKVTHDKPFNDSKRAISHANKGENKTGYVHRVHKVRNGKIDKQWEFNGGHQDGGWEHFSDFKGELAHQHIKKT